ncbi:hypothetical protein ALC56_05832 [Trachymyrmex septentrionalis]|uniref:Uncharacterized protein n=1 Tax=Trachymyrmex septentrionalis TaxID=34720 RepID=A0A151JXL4_9HYME|nr:hypothetical protein ALC56_05832 [Trachymyrmex septentrionalis]
MSVGFKKTRRISRAFPGNQIYTREKRKADVFRPMSISYKSVNRERPARAKPSVFSIYFPCLAVPISLIAR